MRPLQLTMQSFGSYGARTCISFEGLTQELFLVTGNTGSGKTTIFDAIVFALYGETGSAANKKEGVALQSQFAALEQEPFVELVFDEGGSRYTVRRVPRHLRRLTRGAAKGTGVREVTGGVSLILPDGTEYPAKETDKKLEELIGLTKGQFMQVAMIAQGEFMELLRAKSDDKKVIFRKLFHTELYQRTAEELGRRRKEKEAGLERLKTACALEAARLSVPPDYERAQELENQKSRVLSGELSAHRPFLAELELFCGQLKERRKTAEADCRNAGKARDQKRDKYTEGKNLLKFFEQAEAAAERLAECEAAQEEAEAAKDLAIRLRAAWEIRTEYEKYLDAKKTADAARDALSSLREKMPGLQQAQEQAQQAEEEQKALLERDTAEFNRCQERAEQIQAQARELEAAGQTRIEELLEEAGGSQHLFAEAKEQEKRAGAFGEAYERVREAYGRKKEEYEQARRQFLDAQAGYLARELKPGQPCPVCGSCEHPHPCAHPDAREMSREKLEALGLETEKLAADQERAAADAGSSRELAAARSDAAREACAKLYEKTKKALMAEGLSALLPQEQPPHPEDVERVMAGVAEKWRGALRARGERMQEKSMKDLAAAREKRGQRLAACEQAQENARRAKEQRDYAAALTDRYTQELPQLTKACSLRKEAYALSMQKRGMDGAEWQELTEKYPLQEAEKLSERVNSFYIKRESAGQLLASAQKAIGGKEKPDPGRLLMEYTEAEHAHEKARSILEGLTEEWRISQGVLEALEPQTAAADALLEEYARLDTLYRLISGNVKDGRMDLETFVQRYYLSQILASANRRFYEMSAGQFELRMVSAKEAGRGKNRGLDLMVYSTVTGKEREVRTLSGGESFMAALSLALGMADRIQAGAASIHLDIMFIDEGFGSLDEYSRGQAVKVLKSLGGSRLIGIISHVTELKQEFDDQLIVEKDENGSRAHWQIS